MTDRAMNINRNHPKIMNRERGRERENNHQKHCGFLASVESRPSPPPVTCTSIEESSAPAVSRCDGVTSHGVTGTGTVWKVETSGGGQ